MEHFGSPEHLEMVRIARRQRAQRVWRAATQVARGRVVRVRDLMGETGMSIATVHAALADLQELGYLERAVVGKSGRYGIWTLRVPLVEVLA